MSEAAINRSISAGAALGSNAAATAAAAAAAADDKSKDTLEGHASGDEAEVEGWGDEDGYLDEPETMHRLCPTYASDINSPLRWVIPSYAGGCGARGFSR
jgi:hypothetical protein